MNYLCHTQKINKLYYFFTFKNVSRIFISPVFRLPTWMHQSKNLLWTFLVKHLLHVVLLFSWNFFRFPKKTKQQTKTMEKKLKGAA